MLTRSKTKNRLYRNAKIYYNSGFNRIPEDELMLYNQNDRNKINYYINTFKNDKDRVDELHLRPTKRFRKEPIVKVGKEYLNDLKYWTKSGIVSKKNKKRTLKKQMSRKRAVRSHDFVKANEGRSYNKPKGLLRTGQFPRRKKCKSHKKRKSLVNIKNKYERRSK